MKTSVLHPPFVHLQTLRSFWSKYQAIEDFVWKLGPIPTDADMHPSLVIDGEDDESKRWALDTFGRGIWRATRTDEDGVYWTVSAVIDGVEVNIWRAVRADEFHLVRGQAVPAHYLSGHGASVLLTPGSIRDIHPATDPANLAPAILSAAP